MKDVQWHKYLAMLCNCNFDGVWGYFKGPEETYINIALQQTSYITSLQKPLIILPENTIHFGDKIVIKNRPFLVQEIDNISVPGISYCSLQPTTISIADKQEDKSFYIVKASQYKNTSKENTNNIKYFYPNKEYIETTTDGYFITKNTNINIINRTADKVIFSIPFGIQEVNITTNKDGEEVTITYRLQDNE